MASALTLFAMAACSGTSSLTPTGRGPAQPRPVAGTSTVPLVSSLDLVPGHNAKNVSPADWCLGRCWSTESSPTSRSSLDRPDDQGHLRRGAGGSGTTPSCWPTAPPTRSPSPARRGRQALPRDADVHDGQAQQPDHALPAGQRRHAARQRHLRSRAADRGRLRRADQGQGGGRALAELFTDPPGIVGGWYWISDHEVHYRPKDYWPAGTKVTVYGQRLRPQPWQRALRPGQPAPRPSPSASRRSWWPTPRHTG